MIQDNGYVWLLRIGELTMIINQSVTVISRTASILIYYFDDLIFAVAIFSISSIIVRSLEFNVADLSIPSLSQYLLKKYFRLKLSGLI